MESSLEELEAISRRVQESCTVPEVAAYSKDWADLYEGQLGENDEEDETALWESL